MDRVEIDAYQRLLKGTSLFGDPIERALLAALGFSFSDANTKQAAKIFWEQFETVTLPLASRLTDPEAGAYLWRVLASHDRKEQDIAVAIVLCLRYFDDLLGGLYQSRYARLVRAYQAPGAELRNVSFHTDGKMIEAVDSHGGQWVWETDSGRLTIWPDPDQTSFFTAGFADPGPITATSTDGFWIAKADATRLFIESLDEHWPRPAITIDACPHPLSGLAFSPPRPVSLTSKSSRAPEMERLWVGSLAGAGGEWVRLWRLDPPIRNGSGDLDPSLDASGRPRNWIQDARSKLNRRLRNLVMHEDAVQWRLIGSQSGEQSPLDKGVYTALSLYAREVLTFGFLRSRGIRSASIRCPYLRALRAWLKSDLKRTLVLQGNENEISPHEEALDRPRRPDEDSEDQHPTADDRERARDHWRERTLEKDGESDDIRDEDTEEISGSSEGLVAPYLTKDADSKEPRALLPFRPWLLRFEPLLWSTLTEMEKCTAKVINDGARTQFSHYCRVRFAGQLWGYFSEEKYRAKDRVALASALETSFSRTGDPDTSNALEVLGSCRDLTKAKSLWGDSYDKQLAKLVDGGPPTTLPALCPLPWTEIEDGLARLLELGCELAMPNAITDDVQRALALYGAVRLQQIHFANISLGSIVRGLAAANACRTELATLAANLVELLAMRPTSAWEQICARIAPLYPRQELSAPLGQIAFDEFRNDVRVRLDAHLIEQGFSETTSFSADDPEWKLIAAQAALDALINKIRHIDPDELRKLETADTEFPSARIKGFFSQHYSPNQVEGIRTWRPDEWEYLAYRLADRPQFPAYGRIWARVSTGCPLPTDSEIRRLYRFLMMDPDLLEQLEAGLRDCFAAHNEVNDA